MTDITEHQAREGKIYCAVVLDICSRGVVGWSIDTSPTAALTTNALGMAIESRKPEPGAIIHSDHGPSVHLVGVFRAHPHEASGGLDGHGRRLLRQRPHGELLGFDADRTAQSQEVEDQDRAVDRHGRVDRATSTTPSVSTAPSATFHQWSSRSSTQHPSRPDSYKAGPENGVKVNWRPRQDSNLRPAD